MLRVYVAGITAPGKLKLTNSRANNETHATQIYIKLVDHRTGKENEVRINFVFLITNHPRDMFNVSPPRL